MAARDRFFYANGAVSSSTWHDTITDFTAGTDKLDLSNGVSAIFTAGGTVNAASLDGDLAGLNAMHAGGATVITVTSGDLAGHTFLMVDGDGNALYNAGQRLSVRHHRLHRNDHDGRLHLADLAPLSMPFAVSMAARKATGSAIGGSTMASTPVPSTRNVP